METGIAVMDAEIEACFPLMQALRPDIEKHQFVTRIRRQEDAGYRLAYLVDSDVLVAVAGFRVVENLAWGRFLYIDDLITSEERRSEGYGSALMTWLEDYALKNDCSQIHLDSAFHREDAHRFYERLGMSKTGFHFAKPLSSKEN